MPCWPPPRANRCGCPSCITGCRHTTHGMPRGVPLATLLGDMHRCSTCKAPHIKGACFAFVESDECVSGTTTHNVHNDILTIYVASRIDNIIMEIHNNVNAHTANCERTLFHHIVSSLERDGFKWRIQSVKAHPASMSHMPYVLRIQGTVNKRNVGLSACQH